MAPRTLTIPPDHQVCDLKDRIILVDPKRVTVITRPLLGRTQAPISGEPNGERTGAKGFAPIDRDDHPSDRCDRGPDLPAGCSITYHRFWSAALGTSFLELGTNEGNVLHVDQSPSHDQPCREPSDHTVIATCSTAKRFVMVRYLEPALGEPPCWHLRATLWEGPGEQGVELEGDVDRGKSVGDAWTFQL